MNRLFTLAALLVGLSSEAADINITNVTHAASVPPGSYVLGTTGSVTRLFDAALFGGSKVWTNDSTGYISGATNNAVRLLNTTNTHLWVGSMSKSYAEAFASTANDFGMTVIEGTNVQQSWAADFGLLADIDNAAYSTAAIGGYYRDTGIAASATLGSSGYSTHSSASLSTVADDTASQNNAATLTLDNAKFIVKLESSQANNYFSVTSNSVPIVSIKPSGSFKTVSTNPIIARDMANLGSYIVAVSNGVLVAITNTGGL